MGNIAISDKQVRPIRKPKKRVLTPFERLERRIHKQFKKKIFIGDIIIEEDEYELLERYFVNKYKLLSNSYEKRINDPVFATAIVQIGIKYYDGRLWPHFAHILDIDCINQGQREIIGGSFTTTLLCNSKIVQNKNEYVKNILMHGFVSDYYANEMFDFLFKYYNLDLERDLHRNNKEMMDGLIETIQKNDNTGRTYLLVKQTADAIGVNIRGGKIRIRWLLRLIDRCFWEQVTPSNPISRISILFNKWQESSEDFKTQYNKYHSGDTEKGKKSFISPYLKCDYRNTSFKLILPTQLIKFEYGEDIRWIIYNGENKKVAKVILYQAVTGYKTETLEISIDPVELFNKMEFGLYSGDTRIRLFRIKNDCIRFFDKDGDYLNPSAGLLKGEIFAFTKVGEIPKSEALVEAEQIGNLLRSCFELEYGDIVRLPDGKPISIGKKIEEGLLPRKLVLGCRALKDDITMSVYSSPPSIMLKIQAKSSTGTLIEMNGIRYRLIDSETTVIDLKDRSGETGYIINLGELGCKTNGTYTIYIDVPNDRTNRLWHFTLINGINYRFEEAPYIFQLKGTIKFNDELVLDDIDGYKEKNIDENSYNFKILPEIDDLHFIYCTSKEDIDLFFEIPVIKWSFNNKDWNIDKPFDIWHSNFPSTIYMKYPGDRIALGMEETHDITSNQECGITYLRSKSKGIFECNVIRFKSWFGREKVKRTIYIDFINNRTEFIDVITKSVVTSQLLKGDFLSNIMIGELQITGYANYYADIMLLGSGHLIKEKIPIINGKFKFEDELISGLYKVSIFEDEEDDTGFGLYNYLPIGEFVHDIINPYNLNGKCIELKYFDKGPGGLAKYFFSCKYVICDLCKVDDKDMSIYQGILTIITVNEVSPICYSVKVEFTDIEKLQYIFLTFFDGYDYLEFLYDNSRKIIVKNEEDGLTRAAKYRRYEPLYGGDYYYAIEFTNEIPYLNVLPNIAVGKELIKEHINKSEDLVAPKEKDVDIDLDKMERLLSDIGLSNLVLNCLKKSNVYTIKDVVDKGAKKLGHINGLNKKMHKELIDRLYSFGINVR